LQLRREEFPDYVGRVLWLLERYGAELIKPGADDDLELLEEEGGGIGFELVGELAHSGASRTPRLEIRESLAPIGDGRYATQRYEYELLDANGDQRRAFHMHDPDWFARELYVLVHEHCEHPIGRIDCDHYAGTPVKDSYAGAVRLIAAWTAGPMDCASFDCLE
jgi:hypothetical protein